MCTVIRERVTIRNWKITSHNFASSWNRWRNRHSLHNGPFLSPYLFLLTFSQRYGCIIAMMRLRSRRLPRINECKIGQRRLPVFLCKDRIPRHCDIALFTRNFQAWIHLLYGVRCLASSLYVIRNNKSRGKRAEGKFFFIFWKFETRLREKKIDRMVTDPGFYTRDEK